MRFGRRLLHGEVSQFVGHHQPPCKDQLVCLRERQYQLSNPLLVTTGKCRYGYPQVVVNSPVNIEKNRTSSGMIRLTCPHLIKEIDSLEREGGVARYNSQIAPKAEAIEDFLEAHHIWKEMRRILMSNEEKDFVRQKLGDQAEDFFSTGFLGIQMDRTDDVKCLHAHTADEILRGRNFIGKTVLKELESRGVDSSGCSDCWQQCDVSVAPKDAKWWYTSEKNRSKLIKRKYNRRQHKLHREKNDNEGNLP